MTSHDTRQGTPAPAVGEYPSAERRGCGYAIRYLKWVMNSGVAMEIGPDGVAILAAIVTQEDEIHYTRPVNFHNVQLATRCGIVSEHSLIRARQRAIDAGVLHYEPGAKRKPGRYWVTGFTAQNAVNPQPSSHEPEEYTAQSAGNPQPSRSESIECTAQRAAKAAPSIPNTLIHTQYPIPKRERARSRFVPPTLEQVRAYCIERRNNVNAEQFVDHYQANGWNVGKSPMKDWQAAVRTWERNGIESSVKPTPKRQANTGPGVNFDPTRKYSNAF